MNKKSQRAPLNIRFGRYVYLSENSNCWEWRGAKNEHGYGVIGKGGRGSGLAKAHRVSYQIFYNTKLTSRECVCHSCDNPECTNPDHLFLGSQKENLKDMFAKGRNSKPPVRLGELNNKSKLTEEAVTRIRELSLLGQSSRIIASQFFVAHSTILSIINRKSWRHV
jgi:hypothetical protein